MTKIREQIFLRHSPYATSALLTTLIWGQLQRTARLYHVTDSGNAYVMETSADKGLVMVTTYVTAKHKSTWSDCSSKTWNSVYSAHTISKTDSWTAEIRIGIASATATKAWMNRIWCCIGAERFASTRTSYSPFFWSEKMVFEASSVSYLENWTKKSVRGTVGTLVSYQEPLLAFVKQRMLVSCG